MFEIDKLKVIIVPSWFRLNQSDISGSFFEDQATALVNQGVTVDIFYPYLTNDHTENHRIIQEEGYRIIYCPIIVHNLIRVHDYPYLAKKQVNVNAPLDIFLSYFERLDNVILHAHSIYWGGIIAMKLHERHKVKYVITEHASFITNPYSFYKGVYHPTKLLRMIIRNGRFNKKLVRRIYSCASKVITVSAFQKKELSYQYKIPIESFTIIPNVVNNRFFKTNLNGKKTQVISLGTFIPSKNFMFLLKAFKRLKNPELRLVIIGNGPLKNKLKSHKNEHIQIIGTVSRNLVHREYENAAAVISVSKFETFGMTIVEGLACGIPAIIPSSSPLAHLINEKNGYIYKANNMNSLIECLNKLFKHYREFNSQEIRDEAYKFCSEESISNQLINLYQKLL